MNIALIAHDNKKRLMENICVAYRQILNKNTLYSTATTGRIIEEATGLNVNKYSAGQLGGQQQLASQISHNDIDVVIFLKDPELQKNYESSDNAILRMCDVHNIPLATNLATAETLLLALDRGEFDWRNITKE